MAGTALEEQIVEINHKLDLIAEEVAHQRRHRLEMEDLKDDLTIVARDLYQTSVVELEEVSEHVRPGDVVFLLRKLLRNTNNLGRMLQQLESLDDLVRDLRPVTKEVYSSALERLDALERKGYFRVASRLGGLLDAVVGAHDDVDLAQAETSIPQLVGFLRELTKPHALEALQAILYGFAEVQAAERRDVSLVRLLSEMTSPDAKRGLHILVTFLKVVGARAGSPHPAGSTPTTS